MEKTDLIIIGIVTISLLINCIAFPFVPAKIATHWNYSGETDAYMEKTFGLFMLTLILAMIAAVFITIPKLKPAKKQMLRFMPLYTLFSVWFMLMLLFINIHVVLWNTSILKLDPVYVIYISFLLLGVGLIGLFFRPNIKT